MNSLFAIVLDDHLYLDKADKVYTGIFRLIKNEFEILKKKCPEKFFYEMKNSIDEAIDLMNEHKNHCILIVDLQMPLDSKYITRPFRNADFDTLSGTVFLKYIMKEIKPSIPPVIYSAKYKNQIKSQLERNDLEQIKIFEKNKTEGRKKLIAHVVSYLKEICPDAN